MCAQFVPVRKNEEFLPLSFVGDQVKPIFESSGLSAQSLGQIWWDESKSVSLSLSLFLSLSLPLSLPCYMYM